MRVPSLNHGQRGRPKWFLRFLRVVEHRDPPDVLRIMCYRPGFFGLHYLKPLHAVMRGPSDWSVGERELFAAYTSYLNLCRF